MRRQSPLRGVSGNGSAQVPKKAMLCDWHIIEIILLYISFELKL